MFDLVMMIVTVIGSSYSMTWNDSCWGYAMELTALTYKFTNNDRGGQDL
jgi:hypothetical protein